MLFNSSVFVGFLLAFLLLYYLVRGSLAHRNRLIVAASYLFYGWWDWRFLGLLLLSSLIDFTIGLAMQSAGDSRRKSLVALSVCSNLGILCFFKYFNFFVESTAAGLGALGFEPNLPMLSVVLPVGISFYTFQSLSYSIDIYRRQIEPTRDLTAFLAYVSFFPQLVAGPIERASRLLPQFQTERVITAENVERGVWLMIWGMFKKVVLADNLAPLVDMVYTDPGAHGPIIILATIAFGFQIYCDFSGYTDIARGVASILGFRLMLNFNLPYFAASPRDFWRRWHISLSTWFRDYVYVPLGGNRAGAARIKVNLLITMLLAGLWHGAGWNFVLWGLWHGVMLCLLTGFAPKTKIQTALGWTLTMVIVFYGWMLFRAQSFDQIARYSMSFVAPSLPEWAGSYLVNLIVFTAPLMVMELWQWKRGDHEPMWHWPVWSKAAFNGGLLFLILLFWETRGTPFIYFQF